mmetsp:Transcript_34357/g.73171  ORF Transcript_34357/g.73171 Transcript_34357/m.73171 type:complete len:533 (-) Transcript_34357:69-1667(-)
MAVSGGLSAALGICCFVSCLLSFVLVFSHARSWRQPLIQRKIVSILWMVPIYSIGALVSLHMEQQAPLLDMVRDCYEAYVVYVFFSLCVAYLGISAAATDQGPHAATVNQAKVLLVMQEQGLLHHPPPFDRCLRPWNLASASQRFLRKCRLNILQFVVVKPFCTFLAVLLTACGAYKEGSIDFGQGYVYVAFLDNLSVSLSLYYLVLFYKATRAPLAPHKPLAKFLCIKSVVFFTWWQGLFLSIFCWLDLAPKEEGTSCSLWATSLQNILIQFEMLALAIVHVRVFHATEYKFSLDAPNVAQHSLGALMPIDQRALAQDLREAAPSALPSSFSGQVDIPDQRLYVPPTSDPSPIDDTASVGVLVSQVELPPSPLAPAGAGIPTEVPSGTVLLSVGDPSHSDDDDNSNNEDTQPTDAAVAARAAKDRAALELDVSGTTSAALLPATFSEDGGDLQGLRSSDSDQAFAPAEGVINNSNNNNNSNSYPRAAPSGATTPGSTSAHRPPSNSVQTHQQRSRQDEWGAELHDLRPAAH